MLYSFFFTITGIPLRGDGNGGFWQDPVLVVIRSDIKFGSVFQFLDFRVNLRQTSEFKKSILVLSLLLRTDRRKHRQKEINSK